MPKLVAAMHASNQLPTERGVLHEALLSAKRRRPLCARRPGGDGAASAASKHGGGEAKLGRLAVSSPKSMKETAVGW